MGLVGRRRTLHCIKLRDGRKLRYYIDGPKAIDEGDLATTIYQSKLPVIFAFHGMYLSGQSLFQDEKESNRPTDYIVIAINRPGYHGSSNVKIGVYSYCDFALDIREVADSLHIIQFGVLGHSSGGPNVLACSALLGPSRVTAFATLGSDPEYAKYNDIGTGHNFLMDCCIGKWLPRTLAVIMPCQQVSNGMQNDYYLEREIYPFNIEKDIVQPGIVIVGEKDTLLPYKVSRRVSERLQNNNISSGRNTCVELKIMPGLGHNCLLSDSVLDMAYKTVIELGKLNTDTSTNTTNTNTNTKTNNNDANDTTTTTTTTSFQQLQSKSESLLNKSQQQDLMHPQQREQEQEQKDDDKTETDKSSLSLSTSIPTITIPITVGDNNDENNNNKQSIIPNDDSEC